MKTKEKAEKLSRGIGVLTALILLVLIIWLLLSYEFSLASAVQY